MANIFYGDVNGDGTFGTRDLTLIKSHINGVTTLSGDSFLRADINNDGRLNETNLNALNDILTKTVATSTYIDDEQITGVFKLKSTTNNFIISNIILNTDGSFTTLTTSTESDDRSGTYTLTVNFTYDTTVNYKSNDGVILANTAYEVLSWDGIPLSRNWSVFDTTISSTGLFENFSGDISTSVTDTDKPTILKHTNFVNIFKGSSLTNYGNFDNWDKKGTTLVRMSGNLMANGFQIAGQMKIVDSSDETVIQWDSGYKGTYELDINPNILTDTFTIEMNDSVDVAIAVRNEGVIQKIEKNKSDVYKGTSSNISASGSITTVYKQTTGLLTRSSQSSNAAENAIKNIYDLTDVNDITKDFITEPNLNLCGLNQQIMTITKTLQILFSSDITDTTLISKAIGEIMVSEYNNPTGSGGTYNNYRECSNT